MTQIRKSKSPARRHPSSSSTGFPTTALLGGLFLLAILLYATSGTSEASNLKTSSKEELKVDTKVATSKTKSHAEIQSGTVDGVDYYHCSGTKHHLVLLHGSRFTKEDWLKSSILEKLCVHPTLSVSAMDLSVSSGHAELQELLTAMTDTRPPMIELPVQLVTPSASGKTITDWVQDGDVSELPNFVSQWIPVAPGSGTKLTDSEVESLREEVSIFAIYGGSDSMGQTVSHRLESLADAKVLELAGGHPCYLDSPDDFVAELVREIGV